MNIDAKNDDDKIQGLIDDRHQQQGQGQHDCHKLDDYDDHHQHDDDHHHEDEDDFRTNRGADSAADHLLRIDRPSLFPSMLATLLIIIIDDGSC